MRYNRKINQEAENMQKETLKKRRKNSPLRWFHKKLMAILPIVIAAVFVLNLAVPDREFSDKENRNLAALPKLSGQTIADGSFFTGLSNYWSDQFFLRDACIRVRLAALKLIGIRKSGNIYLGRDGYLLQEPALPDQEALDNSIQAINSFTSANSGVNSYMLMVPGAASILDDKLPADAPVRDQIPDISQVTDRLQGVTVLDAASALKAEKEDYIFYRTDHHWTTAGAEKVYEGIAGQMGLPETLSGSSHVVCKNFQGTLSSGSGSVSSEDTITVYQPDDTDVKWLVTYPDTGKKSVSFFDSSKLDTNDKYAVFFGGNHPLVRIETTNRNDKVLLVFKDSYANCFIPFLVPDYQKIIMVDPRYYYDSLSSLMTTEGVTDVLYLYSANTFMQDKSLADVLGS
ncbi:MAG: DHHW family protein [Eubacterium sp.]|nr:DHHW family protein [Eubacterium sp.]